MAGIVRLFGAMAALAGGVVGVTTVINTPRGNLVGVIIGIAYLLAGLFWLALCATIANTSDRTAAIAQHLEISVKSDDSFRLRR